jgi:hypothetical protein
VLDTFIRIRGYRDRAAEFYRRAAKPNPFDVKQRYLAVADHYASLADGEVAADRLVRQRLLQERAAERKRDAVAAKDYAATAITAKGKPEPVPVSERRPPEPPKLRVIAGGAEHGPRGRSTAPLYEATSLGDWTKTSRR